MNDDELQRVDALVEDIQRIAERYSLSFDAAVKLLTLHHTRPRTVHIEPFKAALVRDETERFID